MDGVDPAAEAGYLAVAPHDDAYPGGVHELRPPEIEHHVPHVLPDQIPVRATADPAGRRTMGYISRIRAR